MSSNNSLISFNRAFKINVVLTPIILALPSLIHCTCKKMIDWQCIVSHRPVWLRSSKYNLCQDGSLLLILLPFVLSRNTSASHRILYWRHLGKYHITAIIGILYGPLTIRCSTYESLWGIVTAYYGDSIRRSFEIRIYYRKLSYNALTNVVSIYNVLSYPTYEKSPLVR